MRDRVFIIGSGSSIKGLDFDLLKNEDTIATNWSAKHVLSPTYFITADSGVILKAANADFWGLGKDTKKIVVMGSKHRRYSSVKDVLNKYDKVIKPTRFDGQISFKKGKFATGRNTGFCALQYAVLLGYQKIYLLGIDLRFSEGGKKYWYDEKVRNQNKEHLNFLKHFVEGMRIIQNKSKIKVISCSDISRLNAYITHIPINRVLADSAVTHNEKMPVFVSHYTQKTPYEKEVSNLRCSLDKFKLDYDIEGRKSLGTWRANSNYCAWQVKKMLEKYPARAILRLDADARIQKYPSLFIQPGFTADIAAVIWKDSRMVPGGELLGGTLYFRNTKNVMKVVDDWITQCIKIPHGRNPVLLHRVLRANKGLVKFEELPLSYCKIFDSMSKVITPVIEHFQASRRFKTTINQMGKAKK